MSTSRSTLRTNLFRATAFAGVLPIAALAMPAQAQTPMQVGAAQTQTAAPMPHLGGAAAVMGQSTKGPIISEETTVGPDGVTTIIRTRRINRTSQQPTSHYPNPRQPVSHYPVGQYPAGPAPVLLGREQWIAECDRRVRGHSEERKGSIIGGLLGAVAGGVLGNVIAGEGDRLAGSLIGGGTGGLAGLLLGKIFGGGKKNGRYDCEAALDGYLTSYAEFGGTHGFGQLQSANFGHGYGYGGCGCQQFVMVPVEHTVRQRVIVREKVKEVLIPGKPTKLIKLQQQPSAKMIKR